MMGMPPRRAALVALALATGVVGACGSGGDDEPVAATTTSEGSTSQPEDEGAGAGAVTTVADVRTATVQIVAQGSFAEPAESFAAYEELEGVGLGSGFIIDPSGIAVTNNHVVTGAATIEVFVGGDDEALSAKVLGVSECSDLAVIDIEGDDFPFLTWYEGDIQPGLEVRAAGFPLGDPEYTLTSGIVSKAEADGDADWASVDSVIEHDANIQPGSSGGPLVSAEDGSVVGVNYAGGDPGTGTSQFLAIAAALAQDTVEELEDGDVLSLGVNGRAIVDDESGVQGIWVSSVDTNSPAGELGLQPGDIIEKVEGLSIGVDGTMKDYCSVLESHDPSDKLATQVLRFEEDARFRGEFSGDELEPFESLEQAVEEQTGGVVEGGEDYTDFVEVTDDTGTISVEVPAAWAQVDGSPEGDGGIPALAAAPDLEAFNTMWSAAGVNVAATQESLDPDELLDEFLTEAGAACTDSGREDYDDGLYVGRAQYYEQCEGSEAVVVGIAAQPEDLSFTTLVIIQIETTADFAALDKIIETFTVSF